MVDELFSFRLPKAEYAGLTHIANCTNEKISDLVLVILNHAAIRFALGIQPKNELKRTEKEVLTHSIGEVLSCRTGFLTDLIEKAADSMSWSVSHFSAVAIAHFLDSFRLNCDWNNPDSVKTALNSYSMLFVTDYARLEPEFGAYIKDLTLEEI